MERHKPIHVAFFNTNLTHEKWPNLSKAGDENFFHLEFIDWLVKLNLKQNSIQTKGQIKSASEASFFDLQKSNDISSVHDVSANEKYQRHWPPIIQKEETIKEFNLGGT